jgi:hypothetical protein
MRGADKLREACWSEACPAIGGEPVAKSASAMCLTPRVYWFTTTAVGRNPGTIAEQARSCNGEFFQPI